MLGHVAWMPSAEGASSFEAEVDLWCSFLGVVGLVAVHSDPSHPFLGVQPRGLMASPFSVFALLQRQGASETASCRVRGVGDGLHSERLLRPFFSTKRSLLAQRFADHWAMSGSAKSTSGCGASLVLRGGHIKLRGPCCWRFGLNVLSREAEQHIFSGERVCP